MAKVIINDTSLTAIAEAIRNKTGKTGLLLPSEMPKEIESISGGGVIAPPIKPTLNDYTWEEIDAISQLGATDDTVWERYNLHVGDSKAIEMNGSIPGNNGTGYDFTGTQYCFILGFNHNKEFEGTGITFCLGRNANGEDVNYRTFSSGGGIWKSSQVRTTCYIDFINIFPEELAKVIKPTKKYTAVESNKISYTYDMVYPTSEFETMGVIIQGYQLEQQYQKQYDYYKSHSKLKKDIGNAGMYPNAYLFRNPSFGNSGTVGYIPKPQGGDVGFFGDTTAIGAVFNFKV